MAKLFNFKKGTIIFINILLLIQINIFINCYPFSSSNINLINEIITNNNNSNETDNNTDTIDLSILYKDVIEGIVTFVNDNLYENSSFNETECYKKTFEDLNNETNQQKIKSMLKYSNFKLLADVSHEIECKRNGLKYFLFVYQYRKNKNIFQKKKEKLINFLEYNVDFTAGICLIEECTDILLNNFIEEDKTEFEYRINRKSKLYNYLKDTIFFDKSYLFKSDDENIINKKTYRYSKNNPTFLATITIIAIIILIRIFFTFYINIKLIYIKKKALAKEAKKLKIREDSDSNNQEKVGSKSEQIFLLTKRFQDTTNEINEMNEDENLEEKYMHFIDFISITKNLVALGEVKNFMYNNENLEIAYGFQVIALFFFSLVHTFSNYIKFPSTDYFNSKIFYKFEISLLKFAQYSSYFYLSLNGFIYSFKFMNYYKNYIHNSIDKKASFLFLYLLTFMPKIIMFIVTSFVFHSYSLNLLNSLTNHLYQNEFKNVLKPRKCLKEIYSYLFFFSSYLKDDKKEGFTNCYNYIYSYVNEFYAIIFVIIIFFLCLKFRSKIIDIIIIILIILNLIFNFIFFHFRSNYKINNSDYNFTAFLGEKLSIKYFHIYLNIFFYGAIAGIIHFYKMDIITQDRITVSSGTNYYVPFSFLDNLGNYISSLSIFKRTLIIIINISLLVLLCSIFFIEYKGNDNDLELKLNPFLAFIHIYENHIATIIFMIIVLLLSSMDSDSAIRKIFNSWPLIFISRIGYFFYSICETTILIFLIVTNSQTYLNLSDLIFLNSGQFICGIIISTIFVVLIEIPVRYYCKKLRKCIENNQNNINSSNYSNKKEKKEKLILEEEQFKLELRDLSDSSDSSDINNNIFKKCIVF